MITVANSWISSSETITQAGAMAVFVDIEKDFYSMDENKLEAAITEKTKAVIAVHLHGQMCAINTIKTICDKYGIPVIEDCAQSHFSELNGTRAGLTGIAGSFSFYPGKNLGAYGDAGCIITNDDELAVKCKLYARHGALQKHQHVMEGINSRLDGLQAAILSAKLPYILQWTERRILNAGLYNKYLSGISQIVLPKLRPQTKHTYHLYVILAQKRDLLMQYLKEQGIETAIHYPVALPNLEVYQYLGYAAGSFPVATRFQSETVSLPMYPELTEEMIVFIAGSIKRFYNA